MLKLYNTLTRRVESFAPADPPQATIYSCGPTLYGRAHIGNLRSFVMADSLFRALRLAGYRPSWTMNLTDVDDKTIKGAIKESGPSATVADLRRFTGRHLGVFLEDLAEVGVDLASVNFIRATDAIPRIQEMIMQLLELGYAYRAPDGSAYFNIARYQERFKDYGNLVGEKFLEGKKIGARVAVDEYEKENLSDFALWKAWDPQADANIFWEHGELGKGRPGWHIECSAINSLAFSGRPTDIHTGGVDLVFPHHTNEIAQSQPLSSPFVGLWHHNEHLLVNGGKMAKRLNNVYTLADLRQRGFGGMDLRYFFLSAGFAAQQNFTFEALLSAAAARARLPKISPEREIPGFREAVLENLNFPKALAAVWSSGKMSTESLSVLGLLPEQPTPLPEEVAALASRRQQARLAKDYSLSDRLRIEIEAAGYEVLDTPDGQQIKKRKQS